MINLNPNSFKSNTDVYERQYFFQDLYNYMHFKYKNRCFYNKIKNYISFKNINYIIDKVIVRNYIIKKFFKFKIKKIIESLFIVSIVGYSCFELLLLSIIKVGNIKIFTYMKTSYSIIRKIKKWNNCNIFITLYFHYFFHKYFYRSFLKFYKNMTSTFLNLCISVLSKGFIYSNNTLFINWLTGVPYENIVNSFIFNINFNFLDKYIKFIQLKLVLIKKNYLIRNKVMFCIKKVFLFLKNFYIFRIFLINIFQQICKSINLFFKRFLNKCVYLLNNFILLNKMYYLRYFNSCLIGILCKKSFCYKFIILLVNFFKRNCFLFLTKFIFKIIHIKQSFSYFLRIQIELYKYSDIILFKAPITTLEFMLLKGGFVKSYINKFFNKNTIKCYFRIVPCVKKKWVYLTETILIQQYAYILNRLLVYYYFVSNYNRLIYIKKLLKGSLLCTLARKLSVNTNKILYFYRSDIKISIKDSSFKILFLF